ncbi:MAG: M28 family peptidase [Bacteroidaceae bacterium]|nr:M28 family peptidase [Bacteroidaceae bacterium]
MKKAIILIACIMMFPIVNAQDTGRRSRLEKHLYYLASDSLHGRKAGSEDGAKVRAYILEQWKGIGIEPFFTEGYEMPFSRNGFDMANLVGVIPGNDPALKNEYILLGAHFDHIGYKKGEICNGADDNASGSTALIEIARMLKDNQNQLKRSVIIAAFDGEEEGLWGSEELAVRMGKDTIIWDVKCMMSIDMVGWYAKNGKLELLGAGTFKDGRKLLEDNAGGLKLKIGDFETAVMTATDTRSFARIYNVPTLHVFTGLKSPYHKPEDDADLIDYEGLDSITCFITRVTERMASDPDFGPSGKIANIHSGKNQPFEFSVNGGFTGTSIVFPDAGLTANGKISWNAGMAVQFNHELRGYRIGVSYEAARSRFPDQNDLYGSSLTYRQQAVEVPLTYIIQNNDPTARFYFGIGANARYVLGSSLEGLDYKTNNLQWGYHFLLGAKIGHLYFEDYFLNQWNDLFESDAGAPKARINITTFKIGWVF